MKEDLVKRSVFQEVFYTNLRPDILLSSQLTVPWKERTDEAYGRKFAKYQELADACSSKGWNTLVFPVEVKLK